jgi:aspartyl-tRNA(Asn)/glutamyl-tRNA(Gln) amidotransferase subunit A
MSEFYKLTASQLKNQIREKKISAKEIADSIIGRNRQINKKINGFCHFDEDIIQKRAEALDKTTNPSPLFKIPIAIKDNICVKDELTTCSSRILEGFRPPYDATVITKLKEQGALLLGKANMDEFAFGSSCETSCYGPTKNPYDLERIPGGSSGGSASLVASDGTTLALGSDTGGSIRQPAALCGVVGFKPTYGRVSRYGLIAFGSSLDQIGPIAKDVTDCALLLNAISGYDPMDSTSVDIAVPDYTKSLTKDIKGLRIGLPKEYLIEGLDSQIKSKIDSAVSLLKGLGAEFIDISLPHTEYAVSVYYIVACSEASSNLARFDGVQYGLRCADGSLIDMYKKTRQEGFGQEAKRRIILGTYSLSSGYYDAYYLKAQKVRQLIKKDFDEAFKRCDIILTPTSPTPAFKLGEKTKNPLQMYLSDIFTIPANLAGIPAISVPCGYSNEGLPIGMQFIAKPFDEETLIRASFTYEQNADWKKIKPNI